MRQVALNSRKYPGLFALVDDADYELVSQYSWAPDKRRDIFYARGKIDGKSVYMHRLLWPAQHEIDHEDGNGLNNQRCNLRPATRAQQLQNRAKAHGDIRNPMYKGVYRNTNPEPQKNPWRAELGGRKGKRKHLGVFSNPEDAARAYDRAAREAFGEYARTNFKEEGDYVA